ncbi:MAG: M23 family metallopeptidase [Sphingobacteriales bacterium]|nr:MAG: M23 family metallopeptidase [Sphingobacteriales bacterium]
MNRFLFLFILSVYLYTGNVFAQQTFPQALFRNPLQIPVALAGSFAECRPNHFHTGIDLKTNNKENLPVLAAADGYISRISVSHSGYGNCLYLTHPNGYTTVYGHLNDFVPQLMAYLKQQQYAQKKWNVNIELPAGTFNFKQGDQIAFSGNTGGSTAPHLHFEIRDSKTEAVFNPLLFGFGVKDNIAPKAKQIAYYNADNFYGSQPVFVTLPATTSGKYLPGLTKIPFAKVFAGVDVLDYVNGSQNWLGVRNLKLFDGTQLLTEVALEGLFFSQNRAINAYADYRTYKSRNIWFQGLYRLKNNPLDIYSNIRNRGIIDLSDGKIHQIRIVMEDAFNNVATILHSLQYTLPVTATEPCKGRWTAGIANYYRHFSNQLFLELPAACLYDDVCVNVKAKLNPKGLSCVFDLLSGQIPAHDYFKLGIKLHRELPPHLHSKLVFIHKIPNASLPGSNSQDAQVAQLEGHYAVARVRSFGQYTIGIDTIPPVLKRVNNSHVKKIQITATDQLTGIKTFNGSINGAWACFNRVGNQFYYTLSSEDPEGTLQFEIIATDESNNEKKLMFSVKH